MEPKSAKPTSTLATVPTPKLRLSSSVILPATLARYRHGVQRGFLRPVAVGVRKKDRLQNRFKHHLDHRLSHPVRNRRNAKQPFPATLLRNGNRLDRRREGAPGRHPVPDFVEIVFQLRFELPDRLFVDSCASRIVFDSAESLRNQFLWDIERFCRTHAPPPVSGWT